ncbi:MAG: hypothetical protein AB197_00160 [Parcubacteria bacterium C7867-002]|nr:MAG: hypothetical protein AB197_00160 [Parcubacteria bacterium C7867-002]
MLIKIISHGTTHKLPDDLRKALSVSSKACATWEDITPLARNEWICWTISVKNEKTRTEHVKRTIVELAQGKRRPCCWLGCVHRTDKPMSASQKYVLGKRGKNKVSI